MVAHGYREIGSKSKIEPKISPSSQSSPNSCPRAEFDRFWAFVAIRRCDSDTENPRIDEREDWVAARDFAHELIERITTIVSVAFRRPWVTCSLVLLGASSSFG